MKIKKTKKLIIILLASFLMLSVFVALVPMFSNLKHNSSNNNLEVAAWEGSGTSSAPYLIKSETDMNTLATNVNNGTNYKGKYFKLDKDLEYDAGSYDNTNYTPIGNGRKSFCGVFDGAGHYIDDIVMYAEDFNPSSSSMNLCLGIFGSTLQDGDSVPTIKNLYVKSMYIYNKGDVKCGNLMAGAIVGYTQGALIENCYVGTFYYQASNASVTLYTSASGQYIGGLVGINSAKSYDLNIKNCAADDVGISFARGTSCNYVTICTGMAVQGNLKNCVVSSFSAYSLGTEITEKNALTDQYGSISNCYKSTSDSYGFGETSTTGSSGSTWYLNKNYSKWPYLRQFMTWGIVEFTKNIEGGSISKALIEVPGSGIYLSGSKLTSTSLDIYGTPITVTAKEGFTCASPCWKRINNNEYQAQFEAASYTITYYDAYRHSNPESYTALDTITLSYPKRDGYEFEGWTGSNGTTPQKSVTISNSTGNLTYTAHWTVENYTITYDYNGGSLPAGQTNRTTYNIETASFTLKNPTRAGYIFAGWTGSNGTTKQKTVTISKGSYGNKTYKANWTLQIYKIEYDLDGGARDQVYLGSYTVANTPFTLDYSPTKVGYEFIGWTGSNGTTAQKSITVASGTTGDLEYTANWERIKIYITFAKIEGTTLLVNGVEQEECEGYVYYGSIIETSFDGVNNIYSYTLQTMSGTNITVGYKVEDKEKWVSKFNLPKDNGVNSREEPTWEVDHEDIGGSKQFTITPTIELKEYEGELA